MSAHDELLALAEMAALGELEAADRARLDAHLAAGCAECAAAMRRGAELADELAAVVTPMDPSPERRDELMARVHEDALARTPAARRRSWQPWALAASALLALALGVRLFQLSGRLEEERLARREAAADYRSEHEELRRTLARMDAEARDRARMERELASLRGTVDALTAQATRTVPLAGQGPQPEASARAYVDPDGHRLILYVYDLAQAPPGKSYQLWVIEDGRPRSAGVLQLGPAGEARHETIADAQLKSGVTIAVTLEPEGGRDQPSGPIVLAGNPP